ncbi:tail completion protein gp17 [Sphingomonas nostoxanthinifaciens]|uniref:tail completion protein gp17 n=1 Tax=Sphingomonas nostoxanthinifaciens TaxID=2872652 RepID=UPI001CC1D187|nr:DUF3168 domain-containing protein [Sphingomonas nostoxanthinifaciens]UAK23668.1 DUF3168 domain-containing protein [Sphingomonas nostoxanthinifaciens]
MIDLLSAVQQAVYDALVAANIGMPVYTAPPEGMQPPYMVVADMDNESEADKGDGQFEYITFEVHFWIRGGSRVPLLQAMHAGRVALDNKPLAADGARIENARWLKGSVSRAGPDGVTYVGVNQFETYGQPA